MATAAIVRNEFVAAGDLDGGDIRCPQCKSNTLMLYGNSQMVRTEVLENGEVKDIKLDESTHAFEIEIIECLGCQTRWHVKTKEVVALEGQVRDLRQMLLNATGRDPYAVRGN